MGLGMPLAVIRRHRCDAGSCNRAVCGPFLVGALAQFPKSGGRQALPTSTRARADREAASRAGALDSRPLSRLGSSGTATQNLEAPFLTLSAALASCRRCPAWDGLAWAGRPHLSDLLVVARCSRFSKAAVAPADAAAAPSRLER